jgi:hypothetical protein
MNAQMTERVSVINWVFRMGGAVMVSEIADTCGMTIDKAEETAYWLVNNGFAKYIAEDSIRLV